MGAKSIRSEASAFGKFSKKILIKYLFLFYLFIANSNLMNLIEKIKVKYPKGNIYETNLSNNNNIFICYDFYILFKNSRRSILR